MSRWIALHGPAGCGKDTVARILVERYGFTRIAFADPVREMALAIDPWIPFMDSYGFEHWFRLSQIVEAEGWDGAKRNYAEVRRLLQRIGTDAVRTQTPNYWCELAQVKAKRAGGGVAFTDTRFPNEGNMVRANGGIVVRLHTEVFLEGDNAKHISESSMKDFIFDLELDNPRTEDELELAQRMERFAELLMERLKIAHLPTGSWES